VSKKPGKLLLQERLNSEHSLRVQATRYERELRKEGRLATRLLTTQMSASHEAVHKAESTARDKAEAAIEHRLEGMNEFRDQLRQQATSFLTTAVFDAHWKDLGTQLVEIKSGIIDLQKKDLGAEERQAGRQRGQGLVIAAIIGSITVASLILGLIIGITNLLSR